MRRFAGESLVIATHNPGKLREISVLLSQHVGRFLSAADLNLPEPEETGSTFAENAALKARGAAKESGLPALADDSGLAVRALGGAPGIYSARWAGPKKDFNAAMARVQAEMAGQDDRAAAFICALAMAWPDGHAEIFEGRVEGEIVWPPRGEKGFGYDPIFAPVGPGATFAEMEPEDKHRLSHRARAFAKLAAVFE